MTRSCLREMDPLAAWMSPSATPATQNAHARSSSSRRLCVRRLPTRAAAPPRGSVYCASTLSLTCVMSWCESHVWCEMCVMSVVRAKCCAMSWCVRCERLRRGGAAAEGGRRKERRVLSEKQEPHTVMWVKTLIISLSHSN